MTASTKMKGKNWIEGKVQNKHHQAPPIIPNPSLLPLPDRCHVMQCNNNWILRRSQKCYWYCDTIKRMKIERAAPAVWQEMPSLICVSLPCCAQCKQQEACDVVRTNVRAGTYRHKWMGHGFQCQHRIVWVQAQHMHTHTPLLMRHKQRI